MGPGPVVIDHRVNLTRLLLRKSCCYCAKQKRIFLVFGPAPDSKDPVEKK